MGIGRGPVPLATALVAVLAVILLAVPAAHAGTYRVVACDAAPRGESASWHAHAEHRMAANASCPTRGDERRGLVVRSQVNVGRVRHGRGAYVTFKAPAGARLRGIELDWDGRRARGDWTIGLRDGRDKLLSGCRAEPHGQASRCRLGERGAERPVTRSLDGRRSVSIVARCGAHDGCSTAATGNSRDRTRVRLAVHRATVEVGDGSEPNLSAQGGLLDRGWQRGVRGARLEARDNVGIRAAALRIDGASRGVDRFRCDYARRAPCPKAARTFFAVGTGGLPDGRHALTLTATDTAGNTRRLERTLRVDNHAPARVRDIEVLGPDRVRRRNSFDIRWTPPPRQVAPIAAARYRLCRTGSRGECVRGERRGAARGIEDLAVPSRGDWRLRAWLVDAAGNADRGNASAAVTLRFDERAPSRLRAALDTGEGPPDDRVRVGFGSRPDVVGSLTRQSGAPLRRAPLTIHSRVRGKEGFRQVGTTRTGDRGRFRYRLPKGPSRTIRVRYGGSERQRPASAEVRLAVRAKSTLEVNRNRVRNGGRVRFNGKLLGGHVPNRGKLVQLEAFYREKWRTFAVVRTEASGEWSRRYRFEATTGRVTYPFRARIPKEKGYPYAVGHSRVVRVTVIGG